VDVENKGVARIVVEQTPLADSQLERAVRRR
jgi:hypothetical protein